MSSTILSHVPNPLSLLSQSGLWEHRCWSLSQCPPLTDKVAVITGGNGGIGSEIVLQLLKKDVAKVVVLARSKDKFERAKRDKWIPGLGGDEEKVEERVEFWGVDLVDLKNVREVGELLARKLVRLDMLFLHAGLGLVSGWTASPQGVEKVFAANYLGHFALAVVLLPRMVETAAGLEGVGSCRVVVTSSSLHVICRGIDYEAVVSEKKVGGIRQVDAVYRYARSKLANILFTRELTRRLEGMEGGKRIYANVFFPGNVATETMDGWKGQFGDFMGGLIKKGFGAVGQSLEDAATTALFLGCAKEVEKEDIRGGYFVPVAYKERTSDVAEKAKLGEELWAWSEKMFMEA